MPRRKNDDGKTPGEHRGRRGVRKRQERGEAEVRMTRRARTEAEKAASQVHGIMGRLAEGVEFDVDSLRRHGVSKGDAAVAWACFTATIVKYVEDETIEPDKALTALGQSTRIAVKLAEMNADGEKVDAVKVSFDAEAIMPAAQAPATVEAPEWDRTIETGDQIGLH